MLLEGSLPNSERKILYHFIHAINQRRYVTQVSESSLLHLSLDGWTAADNYSFDHLYEYVSVLGDTFLEMYSI